MFSRVFFSFARIVFLIADGVCKTYAWMRVKLILTLHNSHLYGSLQYSEFLIDRKGPLHACYG